VPSVQGGKLWFNDLFSFSALRATTDSSAKRVKRNGGSTGSQRTIRVRLHLSLPSSNNLQQDASDDSQGFKMRLVIETKDAQFVWQLTSRQPTSTAKTLIVMKGRISSTSLIKT
jgi:hypothetical protein